MRSPVSPAPQFRHGHAIWAFSGPGCEVLFVGKGPQTERLDAYQRLAPAGQQNRPLSWPRQIHSTVVLDAHQEGLCGDGDAIRTQESGTALSVVTADCVPIVIAGPNHLSTIHAGWRGLAGGLIRTTLDEQAEDPGVLYAWIGPAIGACCYEVGPEVADQVVAASAPEVKRPGRPRPHLDLTRAAAIQLFQGGVRHLQTLPVCTRCCPDWLWSYRRDGAAAGRNWTFAWKP